MTTNHIKDIFDAAMMSAITENQEQMDAAIQAAKDKGLGVASISNTGLPDGKWRISFVPQSAFMKGQGDE